MQKDARRCIRMLLSEKRDHKSGYPWYVGIRREERSLEKYYEFSVGDITYASICGFINAIKNFVHAAI